MKEENNIKMEKVSKNVKITEGPKAMRINKRQLDFAIRS